MSDTKDKMVTSAAASSREAVEDQLRSLMMRLFSISPVTFDRVYMEFDNVWIQHSGRSDSWASIVYQYAEPLDRDVLDRALAIEWNGTRELVRFRGCTDATAPRGEAVASFAGRPMYGEDLDEVVRFDHVQFDHVTNTAIVNHAARYGHFADAAAHGLSAWLNGRPVGQAMAMQALSSVMGQVRHVLWTIVYEDSAFALAGQCGNDDRTRIHSVQLPGAMDRAASRWSAQVRAKLAERDEASKVRVWCQGEED